MAGRWATRRSSAGTGPNQLIGLAGPRQVQAEQVDHSDLRRSTKNAHERSQPDTARRDVFTKYVHGHYKADIDHARSRARQAARDTSWKID